MTIQLFSPKVIDLTSGGADGRRILRLTDSVFQNRIELVFKNREEFDKFAGFVFQAGTEFDNQSKKASQG